MDSPVAAVSESLESLFEFELVFEFAFEFELEFELEFEFEFPPPTRFWMKSCNLPHWTGWAGNKQATRHSEQATTVIRFIVPNRKRWPL